MADDLRIRAMIDTAIGPGVLTEQRIPGGHVYINSGVAVQLLAAADAVDPLRALLADEDQIDAIVSKAFTTLDWRFVGPGMHATCSAEAAAKHVTCAVLAALREVAGL